MGLAQEIGECGQIEEFYKNDWCYFKKNMTIQSNSLKIK